MMLLVLLFAAAAAALQDSLPDSCGSRPASKYKERKPDVVDELVRGMEARNIEKNLKYLTSQAHMGGTRADFEQAEYIRSLWANQGLDQVILRPYEVTLSFPHQNKPSRVSLLDDKGFVKFTSALLETPEEGAVYDETVPPAFVAFSASGKITTDELIFANYGSYEDFQLLERNLSTSVRNRLVIIRYGKFFRGDKILNAQRFGAAGVILYSDPADYAESSSTPYPFSWWLPGDGVQRGTIVWKDGDPSTPMYPALDGAYRIPEEKMDLPAIPVHPIGFNDAMKILVQMGGPEVPPSWRGGLNLTYRLGPKLTRPGWKVQLEVNNEKRLAPTYNVIGIIRGSVEPDRYIIHGNHRDAWVFGSVDPSSATATLLELVRSYSVLLKRGWRPRRSILFCSWGAGEFGYMGSIEWIEENLPLLSNRAVAHLNVDLAVVHNYNLLAVASPLLHSLMVSASKQVPAPEPGTNVSTLYDHWSQRRTFTDGLVGYGLGSVSDHAPFYQRLGVPCTYMLWMPDPTEWPNVDYPLYHSTYETFDAMKKFLDPDFSYHLAIGRLWAVIGLVIADSQILPFDVQDETKALNTFVEQLETNYGRHLQQQGISLAYLKNAVNVFGEAADAFSQHLARMDLSNELEVRMINDQLMQVEKAFIYTEGLPRRPHMKNVIFGTSIFDQYSGSMLPGVEEALINVVKFENNEAWDEVRHQLTLVVHVIQASARILRDIRNF